MKSTRKFAVVSILVAVMFMFAVPSFAGHHNNNSDNDAAANATANSNLGQDQLQGQGQSSNVENTIVFPETKDLVKSKTDARGYRGFNNPAEISYPGMPGYFGTATPGSQFQSSKTLLIYKDVFTVDELKKMAKVSFGSKVIVTPLVDEVADEDKAEFVKMMLRKPGDDLEVTVVGYITVKATSKGTVSMEILAEAALAARNLGADVIHVTAEGVDRELRSFGWGVGLSYTHATLSSTEDTGGVAAGGTGISGGSAGYADLPWFQVFALKVK